MKQVPIHKQCRAERQSRKAQSSGSELSTVSWNWETKVFRTQKVKGPSLSAETPERLYPKKKGKLKRANSHKV